MFIVFVLANLLCSFSFNAFSQEARLVNQINKATTPTEETMLLVAARITEIYHADALACPSTDYACIVDGLKKTDIELGYSLNMQWDEVVLGIIEKMGLEVLSK